MDDSRLLQEPNLTAREPRKVPYYVIQATASEGLAQGPYVRLGLRPCQWMAPNLPLCHRAPVRVPVL